MFYHINNAGSGSVKKSGGSSALVTVPTAGFKDNKYTVARIHPHTLSIHSLRYYHPFTLILPGVIWVFDYNILNFTVLNLLSMITVHLQLILEKLPFTKPD